MKRVLIASLLFALVAGPLSAAERKTSSQSQEGAYGLELAVEPTEQPDVYVCRAEVKDLQTEKVLSAPRMTFQAGRPATAKTTSWDLVSTLSVSVNPEKQTAATELTITKAGRIVAAQKATLRLK